jgi:hypothetical protein
VVTVFRARPGERWATVSRGGLGATARAKREAIVSSMSRVVSGLYVPGVKHGPRLSSVTGHLSMAQSELMGKRSPPNLAVASPSMLLDAS